MTPIFFHHILAIDRFQISQDKICFGKHFLDQIWGFFQHFLALFETFITLYNDPCIKFEFSGQFFSIETLFEKHFLKMY